MSRLKRMPGIAWLVIGAAMTALLLPTAAYAGGALTFKGVEGTSGNKADVTSAGQLQVSDAGPAAAYISTQTQIEPSNPTTWAPIAAPVAGKGLMVTSIHVSTYADPTPQANGGYVPIYIGVNVGSNCAGGNAEEVENVIPATTGVTVLPFQPGIPIPSTDSLCAESQSFGPSAQITVVGYSVSAGAITGVAGS
jgi:hypothetical protein